MNLCYLSRFRNAHVTVSSGDGGLNFGMNMGSSHNVNSICSGVGRLVFHKLVLFPYSAFGTLHPIFVKKTNFCHAGSFPRSIQCSSVKIKNIVAIYAIAVESLEV